MPVRLQTPPETRPREPVKVRTRSPFAGVTAVNMSPAVADEIQIETSSEGVALVEVEDGSLAQRVGFQKGDVVLEINGERVHSSKDLERLIARGSRGMWEITINRGGRQMTTVLGG